MMSRIPMDDQPKPKFDLNKVFSFDDGDVDMENDQEDCVLDF